MRKDSCSPKYKKFRSTSPYMWVRRGKLQKQARWNLYQEVVVHTYGLLTRAIVIAGCKISRTVDVPTPTTAVLIVVRVCCALRRNNRCVSSFFRRCTHVCFQFNLGLPATTTRRRVVCWSGSVRCARHFSRYKATLEEIGNASSISDCSPSPCRRGTDREIRCSL